MPASGGARQEAKADDGEDFLEASQDASGDAGSPLLQIASEVTEQPFGLVGVIPFPRLTQRPGQAFSGCPVVHIMSWHKGVIDC
jgi:hypothetical protein